MGAQDDAAVESALRQLGNVAEQLDSSEAAAVPVTNSSGIGGAVPPTLQPPDTSPTLSSSALAMSPASKKRSKSDGVDGDEKKPKKTRQTQSCDACRARKVKCDRPPPGSAAATNAPTKDVCTHCQQLGMACTFDYKPKKRGPPNMYLKRMQALNQPPPPRAARDHGIQSSYSPSEMYQRRLNGDRKDPYELDGAAGGPGPSTLAMSDQMAADAADEWGPQLAHAITRQHHRTEPLGASGNGYSLSPSFLPTHESAGASGGEGSQAHQSPVSPVGSSHHRSPYQSMAPVNPFDAVLSRHRLYQIIDIYFDYVYCLAPVLHKPTFMFDLETRREERPGQDQWIALVFAAIEGTLVHMPKVVIDMPKHEIRELFRRSHAIVKRYLDHPIASLNITQCAILWFHTVALNHMPNELPMDVYLGSNYLYSLRLGLHEEKKYHECDPIERELRKRVFWLQYGGDKTFEALDLRTALWHEVDCGDVTLPSPLDDEFVTEQGYLEQPDGQTPVLAGFYYISKLFRLLGQILDKRKHDRVKPPTGLMLQMRLNEMDQILHQVITLMDNCPEPLRLDMEGSPGARMQRIEERWSQHVSTDIRNLFSSATQVRHAMKDTFLVQQANIYVTQQMVRYIGLQYREELGVLLDKELSQRSRAEDGETPGLNSLRRTSQGPHRATFTEEEKDMIVSDLLLILSKIPLEVIAVNTIALVAKVRYVASTLLDALQSPPPDPQAIPEMMRSDERVARAQGYLWDFLRILSEIETLYQMDD